MQNEGDPEEQPTAERSRVASNVAHGCLIKSIVEGSSGSLVARRVLDFNSFLPGVPADDATCQALIELLVERERERNACQYSYEFVGECPHSLVLSNRTQGLHHMHQGAPVLRAVFWLKQTDRFLTHISAPSSPDGLREVLGSAVRLSKRLCDQGLCASCPRQTRALCPIPGLDCCARCCLVSFLQDDSSGRLDDAKLKEINLMLEHLTDRESDHYADTLKFHPFENEVDVGYDPTCDDRICIGVGKLTFAEISLDWVMDGGPNPVRKYCFRVYFQGTFGSQAQDDDDYPEFRHGVHQRPATIEGLHDLLTLVRDLARDLRKRGRCPGCKSELRLLTADFCAPCCLDAIVQRK